MGLRVSDNEKVRKGPEYGVQDKSLLVHLSPVGVLQACRGLVWPRLVNLHCKHGALKIDQLQCRSPACGESHAATCFSLAINHADMKGSDSCQPWHRAGHWYAWQQEVTAGASAMWCLSPVGSEEPTLELPSFFFANLSFEFSRPAVLLYYPHTTYLSCLPPLLPAFLPLVACPLLISCPPAKTSHCGGA